MRPPHRPLRPILHRAETTVWALMCWLCPTARAELLPHRQATPPHLLTARPHQLPRGITASITQLPLKLSHQRLTPSRMPLGSCMAPRDAESVLSLDHTVCPLISDPAARERLMKIRVPNFRLRRGEVPRQFAQKPYGQGRQADGSTPMNGNNHTQVRNQYLNEVETVDDAV